MGSREKAIEKALNNAWNERNTVEAVTQVRVVVGLHFHCADVLHDLVLAFTRHLQLHTISSYVLMSGRKLNDETWNASR